MTRRAPRRRSAVGQWTRQAIACLLVAFCTDPVRAANDPLEYAVKATYLYKLPEFVAWPPESLPAQMFVLCVIGSSPVAELLTQAAANQKVENRPIVVRLYSTVAAANECQVMYIGGSIEPSVSAVLARERGKPVLTVTDGQTDAGAIGMINFVLVDGRVRFEINRADAIASGLAISSKLLSLAVRTLP